MVIFTKYFGLLLCQMANDSAACTYTYVWLKWSLRLAPRKTFCEYYTCTITIIMYDCAQYSSYIILIVFNYSC